MIKLNLVVKDIINNLHAYDPLAYKLSGELNSVIKSIKDPTMLILDFSGLITLTYEFIEKGLNEVIEIKNKLDVIVLFKVDNESELEEIITGIVDYLELQKDNEKQLSEKELLSINHSLVYLDNKDTVNYIGALTGVEKVILKIIEDKGNTTHVDIDEILKSKGKANYCEEITTTVSKLEKLGFINIISKGESTPSSIYQSIKYLITNGDKSNA